MPIEVATVLAQISCFKGKLPQGSPSSPIISNLICQILDNRLLKVAKKYKLVYTRYADDLTFSTNDNKFLDNQFNFYKDLSEEINRSGFKINENKNRIQYKESRQVVTGIVVNKKLNVNRDYYKETRAMAHQLYKTGSFEISGESGTINQLEGRFAFINQLTRYNNELDNQKHDFHNLSSREYQYQKFLFYKTFYYNPKPVIVTEGKTDILYLKAALKNLYDEYPKLITKNNDGTFKYNISFLKRTKRLKHFLNINMDGASALTNIYDFFSNRNNKKAPNYLKYFKSLNNSLPKNPVILLFDNELNNNEKPISHFCRKVAKIGDEKIEALKTEFKVNLTENLYLLTVPLIGEKSECEIEDLFDESTLLERIEGKTFTKAAKYDVTKYYGKEIFSKYILKNYADVNFNEFRAVLDNINDIIDQYNVDFVTVGDKAKEVQLKRSDIDKVPVEI
ncbi:hypothetical protein GCM10008025_06390 [Ornithinibacillus halotolerans]|uniref:Reverse transcriptase domain-containing protein n=1 Tax=Ornithinibacillus halotolerans TaxID=1274357 RepID=A0A916RPR4_9BACI|nr:hypothetical protein GCM10008025_06390 [Ornithinibacillus halotolerans]